MDSQPSQSATSYATRLDRTFRALQKRVAEQEALLQELRSSNENILDVEPSTEPIARLGQVHLLKATYDSLIPSEPWLPSVESPLPALLALRATSKTILESKECITTLQSDLITTTTHLSEEKASLDDAKRIQAALQERIATLKDTIETQTQKTPAQIAREMIREVKRKKNHYDTETGNLVAFFNEFIEDHLSVMLAAEQLGGPVAGQDPSIAAATLEAGFSAHGKAKKTPAKPDEDKRQQRLDQVWGLQQSQSHDQQEEDEHERPWDQRSAAAADMRELTERLLNNLVEADGKGPGTYVQLQQDSAAARFLVRAKVAQFHPTNGTKVRLLDFGGELDE